MPSPTATVTSRRASTRSVAFAASIALLAGVGWLAPAASGQGVNTLDSKVITGNDPEMIRPSAQKFVADEFAQLGGTDPQAVIDARQSLLSPLANGGSGGASGRFLSIYATEVAAGLSGVVGSDDPRVRLNAAIVAASVARASGSSDLAGPVETLLRDPSPAVVLWATKAAGAILPSVQNNLLLRQQDQLIPAVMAAVRAHPDRGSVAQEAYNALIMNLDNRSAMQNAPAGFVANVLPGALRSVHDLLALRLDLYAPGVTPPEPAVEQQPINFLVDKWSDQDAATRQQTIERMATLALRASEALSDPNVEEDGLRPLISVIGSGFRVLGRVQEVNNGPALEAAARKLADAGGPAVGPAQGANDTQSLLQVLAVAFPDATMPVPAGEAEPPATDAAATDAGAPSTAATETPAPARAGR